MSGPAEKKNPIGDSNPARNEAVAARRDNPDPSALAAAMNQALAARAEFPIARRLSLHYHGGNGAGENPATPSSPNPAARTACSLQVFPCWQDERGQNWSDPKIVLAEYLRPA